ncbi:MAG: rhomboid family intramembrane serine protease, partial [Peptostreptococcus sp.]|nr:rhomboid family intramembrane serine protease [Peptostreptococcus sp.]
PLSSFFLHANFTHLAMNMAVLWSFGSQIETRFGALKFVFIYIIYLLTYNNLPSKKP